MEQTSTFFDLSPGKKLVIAVNSVLDVEICQGDIIRTDVGAVVNTTSRRLQHKTGRAARLASAAGPKLQEESLSVVTERGSLELGDAVCTCGGDLGAGVVIHVVAPQFGDDCNGDVELAGDQLRILYSSALEKATELRLPSVAFPAITSDETGIPEKVLTAAAVAAVEDFVRGSFDSIRLLQFVDLELSAVRALSLAFQSSLHRFPSPIVFQTDCPIPRALLHFICCLLTFFLAEAAVASGIVRNDCDDDEEADDEEEDLDDSLFQDFELSNKTKNSPTKPEKTEEEPESCPICMCEMIEVESTALDKCSHRFHVSCLEEMFRKMQKKCPICGVWYGMPLGNQPESGSMNHSKMSQSLPGHPNSATIVINYSFPNGIQGNHHPRPGVPYSGTGRTAYLPDTPEGRKVLQLLKLAWKQRLVFTVGDSVTTGATNTVVWNNIHHKTNPSSSHFGYPDETYLRRVTEELAAVGITEDMLS